VIFENLSKYLNNHEKVVDIDTIVHGRTFKAVGH